MNTIALSLYGLLALTAVYILNTVFTNISHRRRAKQWGAKPAYVRPHKWPFGIDIMKRYIDVANDNDLQNDDMRVYKEMGDRPTWFQLCAGTWQHVTADPKNIQAMLATQFKDFELGPVRRGCFEPLLGHGIFTKDGKEWEHSRAMLRPQFTRAQVSDLDLEEEHLQILFEQFPSKPGSWTDSVDLVPLFFNLTLDTATEFLVGESVHSQRARTQDPSLASEKMQADWSKFGEDFDAANIGCLTKFRFLEYHWLYNPKSLRESCRKVHQCIDHFVNLALKGEKPADKKDKYVFAYELAKETKDPYTLRSEILSILLAGRDTTAGLLGFTFYFLARRPDVFNRLRQTVLNEFGTGKEKITFESLKACTYLQHVLWEILRIEPIAPENMRRAVKNTTLPRGGGPDGQDPIYIPKGEEVMYNVRMMQRRTDIWGEDAQEFNPDRWDKKRTGWEYLPFNGGPRICIGQQFSLTEAGYVVVRMLQKYDKIENLDPKPLKHRMTQTTAPVEVLVKLHEAAN